MILFFIFFAKFHYIDAHEVPDLIFKLISNCCWLFVFACAYIRLLEPSTNFSFNCLFRTLPVIQHLIVISTGHLLHTWMQVDGPFSYLSHDLMKSCQFAFAFSFHKWVLMELSKEHFKSTFQIFRMQTRIAHHSYHHCAPSRDHNNCGFFLCAFSCQSCWFSFFFCLIFIFVEFTEKPIVSQARFCCFHKTRWKNRVAASTDMFVFHRSTIRTP